MHIGHPVFRYHVMDVAPGDDDAAAGIVKRHDPRFFPSSVVEGSAMIDFPRLDMDEPRTKSTCPPMPL